MSESTYSIEYAKSGKSSCRKCKAKIKKGELRIKTTAQVKEGFDSSTYCHVECFSLPRKYSTGANKMSVEDFVKEILEDETNEVLPEKTDEIVAKIESKAPSSAKKTGKGEDEDGPSPVAAIKAEYEKQQKEGKTGKEPSKKKAKSDMSAKVEAYEHYKSCNINQLKDILGYNRQTKTGNKDALMFKCIDGHVYGRLAHCPICTGVLKIDNDVTKVVCNGKFDEGSQVRMPCSNEYSFEDAPRWSPWYSVEPTEEEKAEIERLIEEAEGNTKTASHGDDIETLQNEAAKLEWKLTGKAGVKKAVGDLLKVLRDHPKKLDLPEDDKEARGKLGPIIQMHRDKSAEELIPLVVEELGFKEEKAAKAAKKEAAHESTCKNPANVRIVSALQELADLYFKEGNRNAGGTYAKAVKGLKDVEYEITEENAKSLHKNKGGTKVDGVGKGTADKIHELLTTGKIEKLEEKRAAAGL